jgi:hypothetical protein
LCRYAADAAAEEARAAKLGKSIEAKVYSEVKEKLAKDSKEMLEDTTEAAREVTDSALEAAVGLYKLNSADP